MNYKKRTKQVFSVLLVIILMITVMPFNVLKVNASTTFAFAGGSGTAEDPYLIETKDHLNNVRNDLDAHYKMIADISFLNADFSANGAFYNNGSGWTPIGSPESPFSGVLEGNGKTISGLNINLSNQEYVYAGLFGYCSGAKIKNLIITDGTSVVSATKKAYAGAFCGYASGTSFENCFNYNDLSVTVQAVSSNVEPYSYVGGISGYGGNCTNCENKGSIITEVKVYNDDYDWAYCGGIVGGYSGIISNCTNYGNISATSTSTWTAAYVSAGGIAGSTSKTISSCKNYGNISCIANNMTCVYGGGICGSFSGTSLGMSYNVGTITGPHAGGIAGALRNSTIFNCYNIGEITSSDYAGGIAGYVTNNGAIGKCYNVGIMNGSDNSVCIGGITGYMSSGVSSDCYFLDNISYGTGRGIATTTKCSNEEMCQSQTYSNFNFENTWEFAEGNIYLYPTLQNVKHFVINEDSDFNGGDGTENHPYLVASTKQLHNVRNDLSAHYKLVQDIMFSNEDFAEGGEFYNNRQGWLPIGADYDLSFTGYFDGNNHEISNLFINITQVPENGQVFAGLFGYGNGCQISNLSLKNSDITVDVNDAAVSVGAILGRTDEFGTGAIITNCTNDGKISASMGNVGGIAGSFEKGIITGCKNYGTIDASTAAVGGIISYLNDGAITNCQNYSIIGSKATITGICGGIAASSWGNTETCTNYGNITSSYEAGGIVGSNWGLIDHCENYGKITAKYSAGGIASVSAAVQSNDTTCGIKNCINNGIITAGITSDDMYHITAGGIAGSIQNGIVISNSWNYGEVLSQTELVLDCNAGGIVGYNSGGSISKCGNMGNITVKTERYARGGGIVGCNCGGNIPVMIDQCVNQGTVYSPIGNNGVCGGVAGDNFDTATISNCFNIGAVTSSSRPGGIIGLADNNTIQVAESYNIGTLTTLTPNQWIGGSNANITNCFYLNGDNYTSTVITGYASGSALNIAEMKNSDSFLGFDFESIWTIDGNECYPYPELKDVKVSSDHVFDNACDIACDCGYTRTISHEYDTTCDEFCNICGATRTITHNYENATCKNPKTCTVCGATSGDKLSHKSDAGTVTQEATCTATGTKTYKCTLCEEVIKTEAIVKIAHKYDSGKVTKAATCKSTGVKTYTCSVCKGTKTETIVKSKTHAYTNACDTTCNICGTTRATTHSYAAATCTKPKTCTVCGTTSGKKLGHDYWIGYYCDNNSHWHQCETCGHKKDLATHSFSNACDNSCNVCDAGRTIKHSYKTTTTKATLTKNGSVIKKCAICGKVASKTTIKYAKTFKLSTTIYTYNGKVKTPSVTVKDSAGKTLKKNTDYTLSYASGRKNVGTYKVTVKMIGKYSGTKTLTFKINPTKTTVSKLTAGKKSITVAITKKSTQVTGYQIQYSTSKTFSKATTKTISSYKTTKYTLKSLSAKKTYYVRVRTYKTVGKTKYYSSWSTYKYIKTK